MLWHSFFLLVEDPFLVVVRDSIIYGIPLNPEDKSNDAMVPIAGLQNGYDVDFDDSEQTIYWVEHPVSHSISFTDFTPQRRNSLKVQRRSRAMLFNVHISSVS